jgi:predicted ATPase
VEAADHFSKALDLLKREQAEGGVRAELELDLQIGLASSLIATKGYSAPDTERTYARALELSERIGETPQLFPVLYGRWLFHIMVGEVDKANELAEDFLRLAGRQKTDAPSLVGQRVLGTSLIVAGNPVRARAHLESVLAQYDREKHQSLTYLYGQDVGVAGSCYHALGLWLLGHPAQALRIADETLERARSLSHANTLGYAVLHIGGLLRILCGDAEASGRAADWLREISVESQLPVYEAAWGSIAGSSLIEAGEPERGIAMMRDSRDRLLAAHLVYMLPILSTFHALGCRAVGRVEEGLQLLDEAEEIMKRRNDRWFEAEVYRCRAELLLADGAAAPDRAEACLLRALEVARAHGARSLELRAATSLARLLHDLERPAEARETLSPVFDWFSEGFDLPDLKRARALLEELAP